MRIALNGFGRIGKNFLRCVLADERARKMLDIVAINMGPADKSALEYMIKYDTILGIYPGFVRMTHDIVTIDDYTIKIYAETDALRLPWAQENIDWVVDASGHYTHRDKAEQHIKAGAKAVLITAPAKDEDCTIILGVNTDAFDKKKHKIVSLGSCTTNALVPLIKMIDDEFGVQYGTMTTVHAYTNDQVLTDVYHSDLRRARSATHSMIPTKTGAASAVGLVLPELNGKLDGYAIRVPTINVSIVDLSFISARETTIEEVNSILKAAADGPLKGILNYSEEPLVSVDYNHDPASSTVDAGLTKVSGSLVKVSSWYDNEWGFSNRMLDTTVALMSAK